MHGWGHLCDVLLWFGGYGCDGGDGGGGGFGASAVGDGGDGDLVGPPERESVDLAFLLLGCAGL